MNDADGAVGFGYGAEQRKGDCVVTTQGNDAGEGFALFGWANFVCVGLRAAHEECIVAFFDLLDGIGVIITAIDINTVAKGWQWCGRTK